MRASTPAHGRSETAAPPTWSRRSRTSTERPARARIAAATRPLWPPPMITRSNSGFALSPRKLVHRATLRCRQSLEQLGVRLPRGLGDRRIGDLAADDVDALGQAGVRARRGLHAVVGDVEDVRH